MSSIPLPRGTPAAGGLSPPPAAPTPEFSLTPEQAELLARRGVLSPDVAALYRNVGIGPRSPQGLPGVPVPPPQPPPQAALPPIPAVKAAPAAAPQASPKAKAPVLTPEENKLADAFVSLADKLEWAPVQDPTTGALIVGKRPGTVEQDYRRIPLTVAREIEQLYPDRKGQVPIGWNNLDKLSDMEKAVLAQLLQAGEQERRMRELQRQQQAATAQR